MRPELTIAVYVNRRDGAALVRCVNAGDKGFCLRSLGTDANRVGIGLNSLIADVDVVTAKGRIKPRLIPERNVVGAACIVK